MKDKNYSGKAWICLVATAVWIFAGTSVWSQTVQDRQSEHMQGHEHHDMHNMGMTVGQGMNMTMDHQATPTTMGMHGGSLFTTDSYRFETIFTENEVRVYVSNAEGEPLSTPDLTGIATLSPNSKESVEIQLAWVDGQGDPMAANRVPMGTEHMKQVGYLVGKHDLRNVTDGSTDIQITIDDNTKEGTVLAKWDLPYERTPLFGMACPMHPEQASLTDGSCSLCGGMAYQPATVFYECCSDCGEMHRTMPGTCEKCGMEMHLKAVDKQAGKELETVSPRHGMHSQ